MPPEIAELNRWLTKADHDVRTAEVALNLSGSVTDTAGFHCQQAVEKLLKAYLFWNSFDFEKIHDLRALTIDCARFDEDFRPWIDRLGPLTMYGVRYRYPGPNDPFLEEVHEALQLVREVWDFVLERLPAEARP